LLRFFKESKVFMKVKAAERSKVSTRLAELGKKEKK
jgi:hypothetical protein